MNEPMTTARGDMGSKSLIEAPLWAASYQNNPAIFHSSRHDIKKLQILHYQGFDVHMSDVPILQSRKGIE
jgi:hypothetical protein